MRTEETVSQRKRRRTVAAAESPALCDRSSERLHRPLCLLLRPPFSVIDRDFSFLCFPESSASLCLRVHSRTIPRLFNSAACSFLCLFLSPDPCLESGEIRSACFTACIALPDLRENTFDRMGSVSRSCLRAAQCAFDPFVTTKW